MEKMRKVVLLVICLIFVATFVNATADIKSSKDSYLSNEIVKAQSVGTGSLCRNLPDTANVSLYIVKNQEWGEGNSLDDVRTQPQLISNLLKAPVIVWNSPLAGSYDIIIDCAGTGSYSSSDSVDSLYDIGFTVTAVAGTGKAEIGGKDIGSHSWMYDSEEPILVNEMLQLSLTASGENIKLENITIQASGTGNDAEIDRLEVYADENNNGRVDSNEALIGDLQPAYSADNGLTTINLDYTLTTASSFNILIAYQMKQTTPVGEYGLIINSIYGTGQDSGTLISFSGLPITSGKNTVLPEKTCLGSITLELAPNPAIEGSSVKAEVSGLTGCENKTVVLRTNPCGSSIQDKIGSCILGSEGCEINFTASASQTYHACIDKNANNEMMDFGEYAFKDLIVEPKPQPAVKANATGNLTGNVTAVNTIEKENKTGTTGATGSVIEELTQKLSGAGSLMMILEATLVLIFIVLVVIAFRLKKPRNNQ